MHTKTLNRIDRIISRINTHPEYSQLVRTSVQNDIRQEAHKHSISIELLAEATNDPVERIPTTEICRNLDSARLYLAKHGVALSTLYGLGRLIDPDNNPTSTFRQTEVQFGGFAAPPPESLLHLVNQLVTDIDTLDLDPIKKASHAHLGLVRIHPYRDGNGRAARLIQNTLLEQRGYPAAIIPASDRELYISLMKMVIGDRVNNRSTVFAPSENEQVFYNYVAGKVLASTEKVEEELRHRRRYLVTLENVSDKGIPHSFARSIRATYKANGIGASVKVIQPEGRKKTYQLEVVGDIESDHLGSHLRGRVSSFSGKRNVRYSIESLM